MQRKLADLQGFNMEIVHILGESNFVSDVLSRYPYENVTANKNTQMVDLEYGNDIPKICKLTTFNETVIPITIPEILKAQKEDFVLVELRKWLEVGERPKSIQEIHSPHSLAYYWKQFERFHIEKFNNLIYYKWESENDIRNLIVVPESMYEQVIKNHHNTLSNCHSGIENSITSCRKNFWFHRMAHEFRLYI